MKVAVGIAVACALGLGARTAHPSNTQPTADPTEGRLFGKHGDDTVDLPLEHTDVVMGVQGYLVDATVTQTFHNPYDKKIEAVYLFPLPANAAVHEMEMVIGERVITGAIARRDAAERVYRKARQQGHAAALLTQERPNLFTQSVANIEPGARIQVKLRYIQPLAYERGGYELVFPMVAGPRYLPGGASDQRIQPAVLPPGKRSSHDISLAVDIDAGVAIQDLRSSSHRVVIDRPASAPARAHVSLAASDTVPNKDFVLRYQVAGEAPSFAVLGHRDAGAQTAGDQAPGAFFLMAQPPATADVVQSRELIFVLDTSSSMAGAPLAKAKEVIRRVLGGLRSHDTFQVVRFADAAGALGRRPIASKPKNIEYALDWLDRLPASGGTEMTAGIEAALAVPHDPTRLRIVVFLTDGYIGNEDEILARVATQMGQSRLFSFGVGSAVNRYLLEEMAVMGRGAALVVRPDEDTDRAVLRLYERIDRPVLTDIHIDWNGLDVRDQVPALVPDLFAGQPLVVSGRYGRGGQATITVRGERAGQKVSFQVPVQLPERATERPAVATVWARARISEISRALLRKRDVKLEDEIVDLALGYKLMTRYTAFVAVDRSRVTDGGAAERVTVPVEVPESVRHVARGATGAMYGMGAGYGGSSSGSYGTIGHGVLGSLSPSYSGPAGAPSRPTVRMGGGVVTGLLDKAIIRRYIRRQLPKIRYCYDKERRRDPKLSGQAKVSFSIQFDGRVIGVRVTGIDAADFNQCLTEVISSIEFPAVGTEQDKGSMTVVYPFSFELAQDSGGAP